MRKTLGIIAASAFAIAAFGAPVAAAPSEAGIANSCFGAIHQLVNVDGFGPYETVGQLVQDSEDKGQGKNATARSLCNS